MHLIRKLGVIILTKNINSEINNLRKSLGMSLSELSVALMVLVVFFSTFAVCVKYFQTALKRGNSKEIIQDKWLINENKILKAMDNWQQILSQPSYDKNFIKSLSCSYSADLNQSIWNLPGTTNLDLPQNYKFCIKTTSLGESDLIDLINQKNNARPGIYILYAIPDKITSSSKPIRRLICRPITYC